MKWTLRYPVLILCLLAPASGILAQITLVSDLNPGPADGVVQNEMIDYGAQLYFLGYTPATGREVFLCYGHASPMPIELEPGAADGADTGPLTWFKNKLWLTGSSPATGTEIWSMVSGSWSKEVFDLVPGSQSSNPRILGQSNSFLYFVAMNAAGVPALWRYIGPWEEPEEMFTDIDGYSPEWIDQFVVMGQVPYFTLSGPAAGKLWKAPGYPDPILQFVADIQAGDSAHIAELTSVGDRLYFAGDDDGDGVYEPWVSDGSTWGTVKLIDTGAGQRPKWFTKAGNYTYFAMGTESIWRTDGTPQGTHLSADVSASISDDEPVNWVYDNFYAIFFAGQDNVAGRELWSLDVSSGEAGLFRDLNPGPGSSSPNEFYMPDGLNVYFQALVDGYGRALYHYTFDGDSVTTFLANPPVTSPRSIKFRWGNHLSFIGDHPDYGAELFVIGSLPVSATAPGLETLALRLEPNPAFSHTRLVLPESCRWQEGRLRLYDAMGGLRWESRPAGTTTSLPLGALPTGTYWVEYSEPSGRIGRVALVRN